MIVLTEYDAICRVTLRQLFDDTIQRNLIRCRVHCLPL